MRKEKKQHKFTPLEKSRSERLLPRLPACLCVSSRRQAKRSLMGFTSHRFFNLRNSAGFTLLYSVLVTGLLLSIGLAIFNITIKEIILSGGARDSQFAFYSADAGLECALYWDIKQNGFATSTSSTINCREQSFSNMGGQGYDISSKFTITFLPETYCTEVRVTKFEGPPRRTIIESRGFNTCDINNPRRVERALRATY